MTSVKKRQVEKSNPRMRKKMAQVREQTSKDGTKGKEPQRWRGAYGGQGYVVRTKTKTGGLARKGEIAWRVQGSMGVFRDLGEGDLGGGLRGGVTWGNDLWGFHLELCGMSESTILFFEGARIDGEGRAEHPRTHYRESAGGQGALMGDGLYLPPPFLPNGPKWVWNVPFRPLAKGAERTSPKRNGDGMFRPAGRHGGGCSAKGGKVLCSSEVWPGGGGRSGRPKKI